MIVKATITLNLTDAQIAEYISEYGIQDVDVRGMITIHVQDAIEQIYAVRENMITINSVVIK